MESALVRKLAGNDSAAEHKVSFASPKRRVTPYEHIKQAIFVGELLPGTQLIESALAESFNVSRTPIREALTRLEQDGIVQRGDRGLIVRESSSEEILDLYDTRIVLESHAAGVAAERRTSHDLMSMRHLQERINLSGTVDTILMAENNRMFHRAIWKASRNESLIDLLERLNSHLGRYPATTLAFPDRPASAHAEHEMLVDAIEARDVELASRVAAQHFTAARDIRLRLWESPLDTTSTPASINL